MFQPPPSDAGNDSPASLRQFARQIAQAVGLAMQGKLNAVATFTLTANVGETVLSDPRLTVDSAVTLDPTSANAAAAVPTTYAASVNRNNGAWTFTHANTATTDRTFKVSIIG